MAVGVMQLRHGQHMQLALTVHRTCLDHHLAGLASMGAAVHAERTADAAGYAAIEGEPGYAGIGSGAGDLHVRHGSTGAESRIFLDGDVTETAAKPDHHAANAAVAHEQI